MTPMELIPLLDKGMVEELRMYYNGQHSVVDIRNIPATMPDYQIVKMWNSENGNGISVLLADNMAEDSDEKPKRKFIRIVARYFPNDIVCYKEYVGKPYFSIEYEGDGELHCGYGTYDIDVLSSYLRDYFMAEKEENNGIN